MRRWADELKEFKTKINLTAYAAHCGYELDLRSSSKNSPVMRHPNGDKVIIAKRGDWIYFSVRDPSDSGSIIDFVANRTGRNLGEIRKELRQWTYTDGSPLHRIDPKSYVHNVEPVSTDLLKVRSRYAGMKPIDGLHEYLENVRGIPPILLGAEMLVDRIRTDRRKNAVFPHFDCSGEVTGYEIKNEGFTGFASGGTKGLWYTRATSAVERLVIAETAIDALSYAALNGAHNLRLASIAGQMSPLQRDLVGRAIKKLPVGAIVVLALDNDDGGDALAEDLRAIYQHAGGPDLGLQEDRPPERGSDWNDQLRAQSQSMKLQTAPMTLSRPRPRKYKR